MEMFEYITTKIGHLFFQVVLLYLSIIFIFFPNKVKKMSVRNVRVIGIFLFLVLVAVVLLYMIIGRGIEFIEMMGEGC